METRKQYQGVCKKYAKAFRSETSVGVNLDIMEGKVNDRKQYPGNRFNSAVQSGISPLYRGIHGEYAFCTGKGFEASSSRGNPLSGAVVEL